MTENIWCCCAYTYFATADYANRLLDFAWTVFTYLYPMVAPMRKRYKAEPRGIMANKWMLSVDEVLDMVLRIQSSYRTLWRCLGTLAHLVTGKMWGNKLIPQHGCIVQTCRCVARPTMEYSLRCRWSHEKRLADCNCAFAIVSGLSAHFLVLSIFLLSITGPS